LEVSSLLFDIVPGLVKLRELRGWEHRAGLFGQDCLRFARP
jgi:hypothetical protein